MHEAMFSSFMLVKMDVLEVPRQHQVSSACSLKSKGAC